MGLQKPLGLICHLQDRLCSVLHLSSGSLAVPCPLPPPSPVLGQCSQYPWNYLLTTLLLAGLEAHWGRAGPVFLTAILGGCFSGDLPLALCPSPLCLGHLAHLQTSISSPEEVFTLCWASKPPGTGFNTALEAHSHQLTLVRTGGTQVPALPTDHPDASLPPHPTTHI